MAGRNSDEDVVEIIENSMFDSSMDLPRIENDGNSFKYEISSINKLYLTFQTLFHHQVLHMSGGHLGVCPTCDLG